MKFWKAEILINQPISSINDLVDFLICDDNDSAGVLYLRGLSSMLAGDVPSIFVADFAIYLLELRDVEVRLLVSKVAYEQRLELNQVISQTVVQLGKLYQKFQED